MAGIGAIVGILGTVVSAVGTIAAGAAQKRQLEAQSAAAAYEAKVKEQAAMQARAEGQREAFEKRREGKLTLSKLQAGAAASGAGAADPTIINLGSNIAGRSEYFALTEMYKGENRARGYEDAANLDRWRSGVLAGEASQSMTGAFLKAGSTILGGGYSAFGRLSGGTPPPAGYSGSAWDNLFGDERKREFGSAWGYG